MHIQKWDILVTTQKCWLVEKFSFMLPKERGSSIYGIGDTWINKAIHPMNAMGRKEEKKGIICC